MAPHDFSAAAEAESLPVAEESIPLPVALTPVASTPVDFDSDGVPEGDAKIDPDVYQHDIQQPMAVIMQIQPTESNAASPIVRDQVRVIRRQKKVVDDVGEEIQEIRLQMKQKRLDDLHALARRRRWGDAKPLRDDKLYEEWKFGRPDLNVQQFNHSEEAAAPMEPPR